jgi:hypothetical protein
MRILFRYFDVGSSPNVPSMNKKVPVWLVLLLLWFSFIGAFVFGWAVWRAKSRRRGVATTTDRVVVAIASSPSLLKESFNQAGKQSLLIAYNTYPDLPGFKAENHYVDSNYLLLATWSEKKNQSIAKLIRLCDQKVIYQWSPDYAAIIKQIGGKGNFEEKRLQNLRLYRPLLLSDGSLVFNTLMSPLLKIDKNSKLVWAVNGIFHHSVKTDAEGNIWVPSVIYPSPFYKGFFTDFKDDAIAEISPAGKLLFKRSIAQLLCDNGYRTLLLGIGPYERDLLHTNMIQPALSSSKYWQKGDLLISMRNRSTIFLYRPATNKVLWLKSGPWLNQHDARFVDSTRISIFGNDMVRIFGTDTPVDGYNQEYLYNFANGQIETPYTGFFKKAAIETPNEGLAEVLKNGDIFVEETNKNRVLRGTKDAIEWQFVDRIDKETVASLSCSTYISKEEFKKLTFLKNE